MVKKIRIKKDSYFDSVFLMSLSKKIHENLAVVDAVVAMGTAMNIELLQKSGYPANDLAQANANDLVIAVEVSKEEGAAAAFEVAEALLSGKNAKKGELGAAAPKSLAAACEYLPEANLALISLPGAFAVREARACLEKGLHVMLFSDNISLADEIALKKLARDKGLLVMGPDCGTAIINGQPLCFANSVRLGPIGIVAASGTGLQEVACLVHNCGSGVSQAIGTGGRDLKNAQVGGITTLMAIEALARDSATRVLVVISKPPAPEVVAKVVEALAATGKEAVVHFLGMEAPDPKSLDKKGIRASPASPASPAEPAEPAGSGMVPSSRAEHAHAEHASVEHAPKIHYAHSLQEAAFLAYGCSCAEVLANGCAEVLANDAGIQKTGVQAAIKAKIAHIPARFLWDEAAMIALAHSEAKKIGKGQKWLRGYYTGGTLADEAIFALHSKTVKIYSNNQLDAAFVLPDPMRSVEHSIIDLGDDVYTVGRPHPMIDPSTRGDRMLSESKDPAIAVVLADIVLGYGSHEDPAGAFAQSIMAMRTAMPERHLSVIVSVLGTDSDYQGLSGQRAKLEAADCIVMPSNIQAVQLAKLIISKVAA